MPGGSGERGAWKTSLPPPSQAWPRCDYRIYLQAARLLHYFGYLDLQILASPLAYDISSFLSRWIVPQSLEEESRALHWMLHDISSQQLRLNTNFFLQFWTCGLWNLAFSLGCIPWYKDPSWPKPVIDTSSECIFFLFIFIYFDFSRQGFSAALGSVLELAL